jgi:hypothetical protein
MNPSSDRSPLAPILSRAFLVLSLALLFAAGICWTVGI